MSESPVHKCRELGLMTGSRFRKHLLQLAPRGRRCDAHGARGGLQAMAVRDGE
jgi:hypothetical protein